jgi:hypothetical protein
MQPDALPQLIETLLRLPHLEATQLRELMERLPDPRALAQEMVRRGWITQDQLSSLFPVPQQRPTPRETMLPGCGDDAISPDADSDDWSLTISDEDDKADVPPEVQWARLDCTEEVALPEAPTLEAVPVLSGAASNLQVEWGIPVPPGAGGEEAPRRETGTTTPLRQRVAWVIAGLLMSIVLLGSLFAALPFFGASSPVPPGARRAYRQAQDKTQVPAGKGALSNPQLTAEKADQVPGKQAVEPVPPPELPGPPAGEGKAKDEPVRGVGRPGDGEGRPRVHTIYFREGNRQWMERYYFDKNGKVINYEVQPVDGAPTAPPGIAP